MVSRNDRLQQSVSAKALRVLGVLRQAAADCPDRAITDGHIARIANVHQREVIDLAKELAGLGVAVLASCGLGRGGRRAKGRYIEADAMKVREYGNRLHRRAAHIHDRGWTFIRLAEAMDSRKRADSRGQMRLFA